MLVEYITFWRGNLWGNFHETGVPSWLVACMQLEMQYTSWCCPFEISLKLLKLVFPTQYIYVYILYIYICIIYYDTQIYNILPRELIAKVLIQPYSDERYLLCWGLNRTERYLQDLQFDSWE